MIKDSGERTKFETGAVRDMHEGKGRFDLLPMCVLLRLATVPCDIWLNIWTVGQMRTTLLQLFGIYAV